MIKSKNHSMKLRTAHLHDPSSVHTIRNKYRGTKTIVHISKLLLIFGHSSSHLGRLPRAGETWHENILWTDHSRKWHLFRMITQIELASTMLFVLQLVKMRYPLIQENRYTVEEIPKQIHKLRCSRQIHQVYIMMCIHHIAVPLQTKRYQNNGRATINNVLD